MTDYFGAGAEWHLVMTLVEGRDLATVLEEAGGQPLPEPQVLGWFGQVIDALAYCHGKGVIHRDVKPANMILTPEGKVYLVDFGIAKPDDPTGKTTIGARAATPGYSPPEQYAGGGRTDARSDIYALGATMYALLAGREPPGAVDRMMGEDLPPLHVLAPGVSPQVEAAVCRALAIRPAERFQGVAEMKVALVRPGPAAAPVQAPTQPATPPSAVAARTSTPGRSPTSTAAARAPTPSSTPKSATALTLAPGVTMDLVRVPAGEFTMGSAAGDGETDDDEQPQQTVRLDEYLIGKTEVTVAQFRAFVEAIGYRTTAERDGWAYAFTGSGWSQVQGADWRHPRGPSAAAAADDHPVTQVSWDDAVDFCAWLSQKSGRTVRLPTEAEWEKAARGTHARRCPWGDGAPDDTRCNHEMRIGDTTPVGSHAAGLSPYGALDMAGNVWEWTSSLYKPYPYRSDDGREDAQSRIARVLRGGSFYYNARVVRAARRNWAVPGYRHGDIGFRVCASSI